MYLRDQLQELRELGPRRALFRLIWETRLKLRLAGVVQPSAPHPEVRSLPFADPVEVASRLGEIVDPKELGSLAAEGLQGRVRCFGAWVGDFGRPPDWFRDPISGRRCSAALPWPQALREASVGGDVKLVWEAGRFPHAYHLARASAFVPASSESLAMGLVDQMESFSKANPPGHGVHWASSQEVVFRLLAWVFAAAVLLDRTTPARRAQELLAVALSDAVAHVAAHIDYARFAVYNNHLLSEALGLFLAGALLTSAPAAERWRQKGRSILEEQADVQFYADGGYIQQSHNYQRLALQVLLWAQIVARAEGQAPARSWLEAMGRSVDFLAAHQNPRDGRLPNYGANDGGLPSILSSCDFSDFRPTLQAAHLAARGERLYPPGPWDEEAAWFLGPKALDAPLRRLDRRSVSLADTGFHVLRGGDLGSYCAFRCGSLRERFSQIDMLHVDVWWRGLNVAVDGGSYLYGASAEWHNHFMRTASHNTIEVDGRDQMLHFRQFKVLYWTKARLLDFRVEDGWRLAAGEHFGYRRHPGRCTHRRSVLMIGDDLWVVVDTVTGTGSHRARLHWLCGDFPHRAARSAASVELTTPEGPFSVSVHDQNASPLSGDVVRGQQSPPRGWLSRYYGVKVPVPSLAAEQSGRLPIVFLTVLGAGAPAVRRSGALWEVRGPELGALFGLEDGLIRDVQIQ